MKIAFDSAMEHQLEPVARVREVATAAIAKLPVSGSGQASLTGLFPPSEVAVLDPVLALDAINAIRGRDSDAELASLAALERPAASTRAVDENGGLDLSIEMETGTGKTYTYLRTIFELAQARELGAFIIVVPSVAIREGVKTTIDQTRAHFAALYGGRRLADFVYTGEAAQVRSFGTTKGAIDVMIVTLDSFNKDQNLLRRATEAGGGAALIEQIASASPVVILDEPQKMGSEKSQAAIDLLRPILTLRYSATHTEPLNVLYRLTPAEARRRRLVKAVEVCAVEEDGVTSRPHIRVLTVTPGKKDWTAHLEIERMDAGVLRPVKVSVRSSAREAAKLDLFELSDGRGAYADGWIVERIDSTGVRFRNGTLIGAGESCGPDQESLFRAQIRTTIAEHISKKSMADRHGAKVLSLFFIDKVANYAAKDGLIRRLFAQEFEIARSFADFPAEWQGLFAEDVCAGYFATKKAKAGPGEIGAEAIDTAGRQGDVEAERAAFDLIMKGKEDLLSFPSEFDDAETQRRRRVAFIFSHSALREGWDNPNVFQICTLAESVSTIRKRQEIGRGVRIPVDQHGNRIDEEVLNVLTVIPNQSYKAFVADYQKEGEQLGLGAGDPPREGGRAKRQKVKVQATGKVREQFEDLWSRIARKSSWSIESLDLESLARKIEARLAEVTRQTTAPKFSVVKASLSSRDGETHESFRVTEVSDLDLDATGSPALTTGPDITLDQGASLPNVLDLVTAALCREKTQLALPRDIVARICRHPDALPGLIRNPTQWASRLAATVRAVVEQEAIDQVAYEPMDGLIGKLDRLVDYEHSLTMDLIDAGPASYYSHILAESTPEKLMIEGLRDRKGMVFMKLPDSFKVPTPVGGYVPDLGIVKDARAGSRLYLIREVKGTTSTGTDDASIEAQRKIRCAQRHFAAIDSGVDYKVETDPTRV